MGYRHYIWRNAEFDKKAFDAFLVDARKVLQKTDVMLLIGSMTGDALIFNGVKKEGVEPFNFPRKYELNNNFPYRDSKNPNRLFYSVQTDNKPYDAVVVAILILAKLHFGDGIRMLSDGKAKGFQGKPVELLMSGIFGDKLKIDDNSVTDSSDGIILKNYSWNQIVEAKEAKETYDEVIKDIKAAKAKEPPKPKGFDELFSEYEKNRLAEMQKEADEMEVS